MPRQSRLIHVGNIPIGADSPIAIQSMTNTPAEDADATLAQIADLAHAGCDIIRCALPYARAVPAFKDICRQSPIPVIADIHFDPLLAIAAIENGAAGIRINPGNIRNIDALAKIADAAKNAGCCIRVGVNNGSLSPVAEQKYGRTVTALVQSALEYAQFFEGRGVENLKVSIKSSSVPKTIDACTQFAHLSDLPQHVGITEAGPCSTGIIKGAIGIGALLLQGIGDTIRVSLTASPVEEVKTAIKILAACELRDNPPNIIACPTCARTKIPVIHLAEELEKRIDDLKQRGIKIYPRSIAVMGCEVNGPGEAKDADIGIAGALNHGILFKKGAKVKDVPMEVLLDTLIAEITQPPQL